MMERMNNSIDIMNERILYLCTKSARAEERLTGIEKIMSAESDRLRLCENKVTKIDTRIAMVAGLISIGVVLTAPVISAMV